MGIKYLNKYLLDNCGKNAIEKIHLSELHGKTLVIDTSIYLYRFISENALLENMYLFISIMKKYQITPIFVFDGKPPKEKCELLKERICRKKEAENKHNDLQKTMQTIVDEKQRKGVMAEINSLKTQFIRVQDYQIKQVKELMDAYGVEYHNAPNEADEICAKMAVLGKVWGCVTDDMDMFIYDCPYIIRNISLMNHTAFLYKKQEILNDLKMTAKDFKDIMILSGTDYNSKTTTSLNETIKWFYEYKKYVEKTKDKQDEKPYEFYVWLIKTTKYIHDYSSLLSAYKMFILENKPQSFINNTAEPAADSSGFQWCKLKTIMQNEGFMFIV
jgi:5'-3' exonuclease